MVSKVNAQTKITLTLDELDSIIEVEGKVGRKLAVQKLISRHLGQPTRDDEGVITGSIWASQVTPTAHHVIDSVIMVDGQPPMIRLRRVSRKTLKPYGGVIEISYAGVIRYYKRTGLFI